QKNKNQSLRTGLFHCGFFFPLCSLCLCGSNLGSDNMPTFKFEAMDTTGGEVKDSVDALSEEEAQQKIRQLGYFVTKIIEVQAKKKGEGKGKKAGRRKKGQVFPIGGVNHKALCPFTRQFSTLQDAGLP